jgi:hypothetical protein
MAQAEKTWSRTVIRRDSSMDKVKKLVFISPYGSIWGRNKAVKKNGL